MVHLDKIDDYCEKKMYSDKNNEKNLIEAFEYIIKDYNLQLFEIVILKIQKFFMNNSEILFEFIERPRFFFQ